MKLSYALEVQRGGNPGPIKGCISTVGHSKRTRNQSEVEITDTMLTAMVGLMSILGTVRAWIKTLPLSMQLMTLTKTAIIESTMRRSSEMGNRFRWLTSASALRSLRRWQEIFQ